jgi:hypothetical protein
VQVGESSFFSYLSQVNTISQSCDAEKTALKIKITGKFFSELFTLGEEDSTLFETSEADCAVTQRRVAKNVILNDRAVETSKLAK